MRLCVLLVSFLSTIIAASAAQPELKDYVGKPTDGASDAHYYVSDEGVAYLTFRGTLDDSGDVELQPYDAVGMCMEADDLTATIDGKMYVVTGIAPMAISGAPALEWFGVDTPLTEIMPYGLSGAPELLQVTFRENVGHISPNAFSGCDKLSFITFNMSYVSPGGFKGEMTEVPEIESLDIFEGLDLNAINILVYDNEELLAKFREHPVWGQMPNIMSVEDAARLYDTSYLYAGTQGYIKGEVDYVYERGASDHRVATTFNDLRALECLYSVLRPESTYKGEVLIPERVVHEGVEYTVTEIGRYTFNYSDVTKVVTPSTLERLDNRAFTNAPLLTEVMLGEGLRTIGLRAFERCPSLTRLTVMAEEPPVFDGEPAFVAMDLDKITLVVPDNAVAAYREAPVWREFAEIARYSDVYGGVESTVTDESDAPAEYYNLQGYRVTPTQPGLYIRRTQAGATKVYVQ